tara:strand:- start:291 stop:407 length:117 start_codon:yes stop_codon:yes gene_type:complete
MSKKRRPRCCVHFINWFFVNYSRKMTNLTARWVKMHGG